MVTRSQNSTRSGKRQKAAAAAAADEDRRPHPETGEGHSARALSELSMACMLRHFGCVRLCDAMYCSLTGSSVHGDSPGKYTRVGCHALFQGIFLTQTGNECLSLRSLAWAGRFFTTSATWEALSCLFLCNKPLQSRTVVVCYFS